ncbi:hypothetical protein [Eubacterium limosum]|uniref:hypothetical protein n=1 Tax=Eubacterium limosum TaxID=1736 RepID=UPI00106371CE|nr:hypothetical protein [Eubacterium limosum]
MKQIPYHILDMICAAQTATEVERFLARELIEAYNVVNELKESVDELERQVSAVYTEKTETEDELEGIRESIENALTMSREEFDRISNGE